MSNLIMNVTFKKATISEIEILVKSRMEVMRTVWDLEEQADMSEYRVQTCDYYEEALQNDHHTAYLVYEGELFVGCGGISYYRVMPTVDNPSGKKAYIMNMYVRQEFRGNGIASQLLDLLVQDAKSKGITFIALEASEDGKPLYVKKGFVKMNDEMLLVID